MNLYQMVQRQSKFKRVVVGLGRSETEVLSVITQLHGLCAKVGQSSARNQSACARSVRIQPGISRPVQGRSEFSQESVGLCKVGQNSDRNQSACARSVRV